MAKSTLWQWSSTNASNTDIGGTDITGSTGLVKNGDNAIREIMAQMAASEAKGADVASASTIALGTGRFFHITGTTPITDIDFTDAVNGRWAVLEFDGALTLTHNATTLTLPGGANITTAAGDRAFIVQDSGDNMHVLFYQAYAAATSIATAAEFLANTASKVLTTDKVFTANAWVNLGASLTGNITLDLATFFNGYGTLTGNITLNALSNAKDQSGLLYLTASGGARTVSFNTTSFCTPSNVSLGSIASGATVAFSYARLQNGKVLVMRLGTIS